MIYIISPEYLCRTQTHVSERLTLKTTSCPSVLNRFSFWMKLLDLTCVYEAINLLLALNVQHGALECN